jgi:hypothetical protein
MEKAGEDADPEHFDTNNDFELHLLCKHSKQERRLVTCAATVGAEYGQALMAHKGDVWHANFALY